MEKLKELIILLVEDDDGHAELTKEGLKDAWVYNKFIRFCDGEEVWNFLSGNGAIVMDKNKAYLILLDINMPKMGGVEVLQKIKTSPELKEIPIIMLTTTDDPREVEHCYKLGCNVYITKPVEFKKFAETLRRLGLFLQVIKI